MNRYSQSRLFFLMLFTLSNTPVLSETLQNPCELIDGYYLGMDFKDAELNYNKGSRDYQHLVKSLSDDAGLTFSGSHILDVRADVTLVFDEKAKLGMLTGKFSPSDYPIIRSEFFRKFGKPNTDEQCNDPIGHPNGGCEFALWETDASMLMLEQWVYKQTYSSFLIGPSSQKEGGFSKNYSKCMSATLFRPNNSSNKLKPNNQLEADEYDGISNNDKKFISCIYPKIIKGKYSVNDSLEELVPVLSACHSEFDSSMKTCIASGTSNKDCAAKTMMFLHMAVKSASGLYNVPAK